MNTTTSTQAMTTDAAEILDWALNGSTLSAWTTAKANNWGGFDIRNGHAGNLVRLVREDNSWTLYLMTANGVVQGSQTFSGVLASNGIVSGAVASLAF